VAVKFSLIERNQRNARFGCSGVEIKAYKVCVDPKENNNEFFANVKHKVELSGQSSAAANPFALLWFHNRMALGLLSGHFYACPVKIPPEIVILIFAAASDENRVKLRVKFEWKCRSNFRWHNNVRYLSFSAGKIPEMSHSHIPLCLCSRSSIGTARMKLHYKRTRLK
jgi:hypothetical protein